MWETLRYCQKGGGSRESVLVLFFCTSVCQHAALTDRKRSSYNHKFCSKSHSSNFSFVLVCHKTADWSLCAFYSTLFILCIPPPSLSVRVGGQTDYGCPSPSNVMVQKCVRASWVMPIVNAGPGAYPAPSSLTNISALHMHAACSEAIWLDVQMSAPLIVTSLHLALICTSRQWDAQVSPIPTSMCYSPKQTLSISVCTKMNSQWFNFPHDNTIYPRYWLCTQN